MLEPLVVPAAGEKDALRLAGTLLDGRLRLSLAGAGATMPGAWVAAAVPGKPWKGG